jgi:hypothetical protein
MASAHWRALVSSSPSLPHSLGVMALGCILERVSGVISSQALAGSFVVPLAGPRNTRGNRFDWRTGREKAIRAEKQSKAPASLSCSVNSCLVTGRSIRNSLLIIQSSSSLAGVSSSLRDIASALPLTFPGR